MGKADQITPLDMEYIKAFADCDMRVEETARQLFTNRNGVLYHLDKVERIMGLNPRNFYDLVKLLEWLKMKGYQKSIMCALRHITIAREQYMEEYAEDYESEWVAEEFNKATTILERLIDLAGDDGGLRNEH